MDWPTVIVAVIVGALLLAVLTRIIVNKKRGKGGCSCGSSCSGCPMSGDCHGEQ